MRSKLFSSLAVFSFLCSSVLCADVVTGEGSSQAEQAAVAPRERKRPKAHFVGSKRPQQNEPVAIDAPTEEQNKKPSSRIKNEWVTSKTYPKSDRKIAKAPAASIHRTAAQLSSAPNIFAQADASSLDQKERIRELEKKVGVMQAKLDHLESPEDRQYPQTGVYARKGSVYFTGEWLLWQTRAGGLEFAVERSNSFPGVYTDAVSKKVEFEWQSGFRAGFGVHLPHDGWDIYVNYTNFHPTASRNANGSVFPLLAYQGQYLLNNVDSAHAHWDISFQSADVEIGRAYFLAKTLALRPYFGCKGAWIDQHAHVTYIGGDIPAGQEFKIHAHNDFKGAGLRFGLNSNWEWGWGLSFISNLSGALLVGHFDLDQDQTLPTGLKSIDLDSDLTLLSPTAQLSLGVAWDRNFCRDKCHFGLSVSFESQYWWRQNQGERFTDSLVPIYVRPDEDLAFYGLSLMARLDF